MPNALLQLRVNDVSRKKAAAICERLGIDLPGFLRICIARLIQENGIPFQMKLDDDGVQKARNAIRYANFLAKLNGISEMPLEEINEEICASRKAQK